MFVGLLDAQNYVFNPYALPTFSTAAALLFAVFQLFTHQAQARVRIPLMLALLATSIWLIAFSFMYCSKDEPVALGWAKIGYLGVPFICAAIYETAVRIHGLYDSQKRVVWASWIISLIFAVLAFDTELIPNVTKYWWGFYPQYGAIGTVFIGYFGVMAGGSLWHYYRAYEQTESSARKRVIKLISFGMLIGYLAGVDFIPKLGISLYPFGYFCVFISALLIAEGISADAQEQAETGGEKVDHATEHRANLSDYAARLHRQQVALLSSLQAAIATCTTGTTMETIARVTEEAAKALEVERIALWRYDKGVLAMECIHIYRRTSQDHSMAVGQVIRPTSSYLGPLREGRMITVDNMVLDAQMEFRDVHLDSFGRVSVLDVPLRRDGQLLGVMSCLSIGERRSWHEDEQAFVQLLANILALVFDMSREDESAHIRRERASVLLQDFIRELIRRDLKMMEIESS